MTGPDLLDATITFSIFFLAGLVKGLAGFGLPTISLGLLALVRPFPEAMALALLPTMLTNVWQGFTGGALTQVLRRLWVFLLASVVGTVAAASLLGRADAAALSAFLGGMMACSAAVALLAPTLPEPGRRRESWLSPLLGGVSGIVTGLTGSYMMPAAPYLMALRMPRTAFVQGFALGALLATMGLALTMAAQGLVPPRLGIASALGLVPAFLGMAAGQKLRNLLSEHRFRMIVQTMLLLLGLYLVVRNLVVLGAR